MNDPSPQNVTQLLVAWSDGDKSAMEKLFPLIYDELRRIARQYMRRENPGHTLQTTALVNEAYLRLIDQRKTHWRNRAHFFAIAAQIMRRILLDHARSYKYAKRGGGAHQVSLDETAIVSQEKATEMIALDDALNELAKIDEQQSRVVELRFFGGLTVEETAEVLSLSSTTIKREWSAAKAWLYHEIRKTKADET
jgi:RNA polymerase sigma factor (TIGR02999 family)